MHECINIFSLTPEQYVDDISQEVEILPQSHQIPNHFPNHFFPKSICPQSPEIINDFPNQD